MAIKTVGVLGCGLMGSGIAQISAAAGFKTVVLEVNEGVLQKGLGRIDKFLDDGVAKGKMAAGDRETTLDNLQGTTTYDAMKECDLVIEAIVENVEIKKQAYAQVEAVVGPNCLSRRTLHRSASRSWPPGPSALTKFGGLHFFNPVPLMKLVEVVRALTTSNETYNELFAFREGRGEGAHHGAGQGRIHRESPARAVSARRDPVLEEGLGTVEDIDKGMKLGCGHPDGTADAARFRRSRYDVLHREHHVRRVPRAALCTAATLEADGAGGTFRQEDRPGLLQVLTCGGADLWGPGFSPANLSASAKAEASKSFQ